MNTEFSDVTQDVTTQTFSTADTVVGGSDYNTSFPEQPIGSDYPQSIVKFMERPITLVSQTSVSPLFQFFPWVEVLSDANVTGKLANYRFCKGTMNVRITCNANAFVYGLYGINVTYGQTVLTPAPSGLFGITKEINGEHYYLDIACKDEVVIKIPYFSRNPMIHTDPVFFFAEHAELCRVTVFPIRGATSATEPSGFPTITMKAYAWVTDFEMKILEPSVSAAAFALSSGLSKILMLPSDGATLHPRFCSVKEVAYMRLQGDAEEEAVLVRAESGPISGPLTVAATTVKNMGDSMIKATNLAHSVLSTGSKLAGLLGFSRPQGVENTTGYWDDPFGDTSSTTGVYHSRGLTMDPGSLVSSIHTTTADRGDELSLAKIMERESLIDILDGLTGVIDTKEYPVLPCIYHALGLNGTVQFNNMSFATLPFTYWRGSIDFHFRVVASNYHTGRLGVMFSPDIFGATDLTESQNVSSNTIFDVRAGNIHTIRVHWARADPYSNITPVEAGANALSRIPRDYCNGYLRIYSVDPISAPSAAAGVMIFVTMTPGPDFEVGVPDSYAMSNLIHYLPNDTAAQSVGPVITADPYLTIPPGPAVPSLRVVPESGVVGATMVEFNTPGPLDLNKRYFGDPIVSMRALLKRAQFGFSAGYETVTEGDPGEGYYFTIPPYGIPVGNQGVTGNSWTNSKMNLLSYLLPAYAGVRGSTYAQIRRRRDAIISSATDREQASKPLLVARRDAPMFMRGLASNINLQVENNFLRIGAQFMQGVNGSQTYEAAESIPIIHIPYQYPHEFVVPQIYCAQNSMTDPTTLWPSAIATVYTYRTAQRTPVYDVWYATGDDFDLLHYNGPNRMSWFVPLTELD